MLPYPSFDESTTPSAVKEDSPSPSTPSTRLSIEGARRQRTLDRGRVVAARRRLDAQREDLQVRDRREARRREGLAERVRRVAGDVGVGAAVACAVRVSPHAIDATLSLC